MDTQYKTVRLICFLLSLLIFISSILVGKNELFLFLNTDLGHFVDGFFVMCTKLGSGYMWIPLLVFVYFKKRKYFLFVLYTIILFTLFTYSVKFFTDIKRPFYAIAENHLIHTVPGEEPKVSNSFPSGHTGTAFIILLIVSLIVESTAVIIIVFIYALLVAYSRIYLANHFPIDIAGGILFALVSVELVKRKSRRLFF